MTGATAYMYYIHDVSIRLIYVEKHANADQQTVATVMFSNIYGGRQCILVDESPKTETQSKWFHEQREGLRQLLACQ